MAKHGIRLMATLRISHVTLPPIKKLLDTRLENDTHEMDSHGYQKWCMSKLNMPTLPWLTKLTQRKPRWVHPNVLPFAKHLRLIHLWDYILYKYIYIYITLHETCRKHFF